MLDDVGQGGCGDGVVPEVVPEFGELIEDDVLGVLPEHGASVVDLLDVALGPRGADDILGARDPLVEPVESFLRHALREHGNAAASHDSR